ncbi:hypothetical protein BKA64DRAFT_717529 [Cadophora sp. MPI-SDFR-AT-0126]|nr:hypothetical protein BKA64DRAFT_717529 [Leotiomycetes sp. MPI-SDFR-AT-0126]
MSFGWSAGDVIAGITFLTQVYQSLDNSKGGKASYSELIRELSGLQNALHRIEKLGAKLLLNEAVLNCQKCIDGFVEQIKKFKSIGKDCGAFSHDTRGNTESQIEIQKVLVAQGKDQGMLLVEVQDQLQAIVSSQAQLVREADTASHTLNSQLSDISKSQMTSKDTVDHINLQIATFLKNDSASRLWIHGMPGKGKTMIFMALVDELLSRVDSDPSSFYGYFFCDNMSDKRNTILAVMKTLLYGILQVFLKNQIEALKEFLGSFSVKGNSMFSSVEAVWMELHRALQFKVLDTVYFVVDALDECEEEGLENFLALLTDDSATELKSTCRVKWILLSRNEGAIKDYLCSDTSTSQIDMEDNSRAIRQSVDYFIEIKIKELAAFKRYDPDLKRFVATMLKEKAEGTFFTKLVLEMIPNGLSRLYDRLYQQAISNDIQEIVGYVKEILRSVTLASRPLSPAELAITAGLPSSATQDIRIFEEYIEQCGSLLIIQASEGYPHDTGRNTDRMHWQVSDNGDGDSRSDGSLSSDSMPNLFDHPSHKNRRAIAKNSIEDNTIHFIHQSAKDYMLGHTKDLFSPKYTREHEDILVRCLRYMNEFQPSTETRTEHNKPALVNTILRRMRQGIRYPLKYWTKHGDCAGERVALLDETIYFLLQRKSLLFRAWMCCFGPKFGQRQEESGQLAIQHFAAYDGRIWLLSWIMQHHGRAALDEASPQDGTTPLLWAVKAGNLEVVRWLLENGACPDITGHFIVEKTFRRRRFNVPVHFKQPERDIARKPETIKQYYTALSIAAVEHPQVFKLLLDFGAEINFKSSTGQSSLSLAAYRFGSRHITFNVCKLFLENVADPNITSDIEYPLLHAAAGSGFSLDTVALLLNHGADRNLRDTNGRTPLHWATYHEKLEALILLFTSRGDINARDNKGHSALYYTTLYSTPLVVKVLVEYGADLAQFQEGARIHNNQHWRDKVWKGTELVNRMEHLSRTQKDRVRFE